MNKNEEKKVENLNEKERRIKLEIRLMIAKLCLISIAGGLGLFIIRRIVDLVVN